MLPPPLDRRRRAIVLVHGAWVGEWSWTPVLPLLEASGRRVVNVSLAGHGSRAHESGRHITQADHVRDVVGAIETWDLTEVVLVGHSYGGRVISAVAQEIPQRLAHLVYLDAHAPTAPDTGQTPERIAAVEANGGMLPFTGYDPDPDEVGGPAGVAWFLERVRPQSFATFMAPLPDALPAGVGRTYVFAAGYEPTRFAAYAEGAKADPSWRYHELDASHWLMFSHPGEVARIVLDAT